MPADLLSDEGRPTKLSAADFEAREDAAAPSGSSESGWIEHPLSNHIATTLGAWSRWPIISCCSAQDCWDVQTEILCKQLWWAKIEQMAGIGLLHPLHYALTTNALALYLSPTEYRIFKTESSLTLTGFFLTLLNCFKIGLPAPLLALGLEDGFTGENRNRTDSPIQIAKLFLIPFFVKVWIFS